MKLKKNITLTFSAIWFGLSAFLFHSCRRDENTFDSIASVEIRADELVASKELQDYQKTLERFAYNYQSKLENLPDSEKQRLKETFAKLSENNTEEILNEASSIIGINLLTNAKTINNKSEFLKRINSTDR